MEKTSRLVVILSLTSLVSGWVSESCAQGAPARVAACRAEPDDLLRLQCYDREFGKPALVAAPRVGLPALPLRAAEIQPVIAPAIGPVNAPRIAPVTAPAAPKFFSAKVTALRFLHAGEFVVTLDNGQIWSQFVAEGRVPFGVGATVKIRPGWMGSYLLVGPSNWITKVHLLAPNETPGN